MALFQLVSESTFACVSETSHCVFTSTERQILTEWSAWKLAELS